jgi:hypothetical protein
MGDDVLPAALSLALAIAEQDPAMVATMRRDWDETGALPVRQAHVRHRQIAADAGFTRAGRETLHANMDAVLARARTQ